MSRYRTIGQLFEQEPAQWGLRGDPFLWRKMRGHFSDVPLPSGAAELEQRIAQAFLELSGQPLTRPDHFYAGEFAHGGLSSGGISPAFWRDVALPLLTSRHADA